MTGVQEECVCVCAAPTLRWAAHLELAAPEAGRLGMTLCLML